MANYATLKAAIAAAIRENGNNEITGNLLQQQLLAMVNSLGVGYQYAGIATPTTNPGTPDQNVFYLASTAGTYTNFGGLVLADGEIAILKYNGAWSKDSTGAASLEKLNQLGQDLNALCGLTISKDYSLNHGANLLMPVALKKGVAYTITLAFGSSLTNGGWYSLIKKSDSSQIVGQEVASGASSATLNYIPWEDIDAIVRLSFNDSVSNTATLTISNNIPNGSDYLVLSGRVDNIVTSLIPTSLLKGTFVGGAIDAQGLPSLTPGSYRMTTPFFFYGKGKVTINCGSSYRIAAQTWRFGAMIYDSTWRPSGWEQVLDGDFFAVTIKKADDSAFTNETISDIGLSFTNVMAIPSIAPSWLSERITKVFGDLSDVSDDVDNIISKVSSVTPSLAGYGTNSVTNWDFIGRPIRSGSAYRMTSNLIYLKGGKIRITIDSASGYQWYIYQCKFGSVISQYGWQYVVKDIVIEDCDFFFFNFKRVVNGSEVPFTNETISDIGFSIEVLEELTESVCANDVLDKAANALATKEEVASVLNVAEKSVNPFVNKPFYYHFNPTGFVKDGDGNNTIPGESLADIELAARLGFDFVEANVQKTADGHFICTHGLYISATDQRFDSQVISLDGTDVSTINIHEKTLSWIQENIRYDSDITKYRTTVPTLEEFCECCKSNGIGVLAGTKEMDAINICRRILADNVVIYQLEPSQRAEYKGYAFIWENGSGYTKDSLLAIARNVGTPVIISIGEQIISDLKTAGTLDSFVLDAHKEGILVGAAAVYQSEELTIDCIKRGFDLFGSGHEVNDFEPNYEVFDIDLDDFSGIASGGIISLAQGQSITCGASTPIIGKGLLNISFSGKLKIEFGSKGEREIELDGENIILSDIYYLMGSTLTITAVTATDISHLVYKTSRC